MAPAPDPAQRLAHGPRILQSARTTAIGLQKLPSGHDDLEAGDLALFVAADWQVGADDGQEAVKTASANPLFAADRVEIG